MEKEWPKISQEQSDIAFAFIGSLFHGGIDQYWSLISKVDKARMFGMYKQYLLMHDIENYSFRSYISQRVLPKHVQEYEKLRDNNPGISTTLRSTAFGEAMIYMLPNAAEARVHEEETQVSVFPIYLTVDAEYQNGEVSNTWKVRLYSDKLYEDIT